MAKTKQKKHNIWSLLLITFFQPTVEAPIVHFKPYKSAYISWLQHARDKIFFLE